MEQNKEKLDNWAKESIKILKEQGYLEKTNRPLFLIGLSIIIFGIIVGGSIIYAMNHDSFKSNINQDVVCANMTCPDCNCPVIPSCPTPYVTCENRCVYPDNLTIKLSNSTS